MGLHTLRPADALSGLRLGVLVSDTADLGMLGLTERHAELGLAEIARAVLNSRGGLVYGGRIKPSGFTQFLVREVQRYGIHADALTVCLAAPEHQRLATEELLAVDRDLGVHGRVVRLDVDGYEVNAQRDEFSSSASSAHLAPSAEMNGHRDRDSYTAMRRYVTGVSQARFVLGGRLEGFKGSMPGIIEESIYAVEAGQPLYVAAGFGGAAALVAAALGIDDLSWAPEGFPQRPEDHRIDASLTRLRSAARDSGWCPADCGLDQSQLRQLAASCRPAQIASLVVNGLTRIRG